MASIPEDLRCIDCREEVLDEMACFNQKDVCVECCEGGCCS